MECKDRYVARVIEKYNPDHVTAFVSKNAEKKFLGPFGCSLTTAPPAAFGNSTALLSREEEFKLFSALHFMKYKLKKSKRARYLDIYIALRNRAISANWSLIPARINKHTRKFNRSDCPTLMEKGNEALIAAVDCFDPWRGYRFCTYACNAISKSFLCKPNLKPYNFSSIDEKLSDQLADDQVNDNNELWAERLEIIMQTHVLKRREKEVLMYRFGCLGYNVNNNKGRLTLKEIATNWDVTKERVRQIQNEALSKLREELKIDPILH